MAKKAGAVRMNITVPADVKRKMDKAADENWSAVATLAFKMKLGEIAKSKENKKMDDVVDRLRATKLQGDSEDYRIGLKGGERWAKEDATAAELKRLDRFCQDLERNLSMGGLENCFSHLIRNDQRGAAGLLFEAIYASGDLPDESTFWYGVFGDDDESAMSSPKMLKGFTDGALDIWRKVREQL